MRLAGVRGVQRAAKAFTTRPDPTTARPTDRVQRQFRADRPNQLRVVPAMGRRHHLRANLAGLRLHRICHRCLHPRDRRLACCGYHTDRADQAASALAHRRAGGACHLRMGLVVQPTASTRSARLSTTHRVRGRPQRRLSYLRVGRPGPRNHIGTKPGVLHGLASTK